MANVFNLPHLLQTLSVVHPRGDDTSVPRLGKNKGLRGARALAQAKKFCLHWKPLLASPRSRAHEPRPEASLEAHEVLPTPRRVSRLALLERGWHCRGPWVGATGNGGQGKGPTRPFGSIAVRVRADKVQPPHILNRSTNAQIRNWSLRAPASHAGLPSHGGCVIAAERLRCRR